MGKRERQAQRALDAALDPGERVRGFTVCEYDNDKVVLQAFARRAVSKGFFAVTDKRLFLIPTRVRDLVGFPFAAVEACPQPRAPARHGEPQERGMADEAGSTHRRSGRARGFST